jgi:CHAT domain-containing protein
MAPLLVGVLLTADAHGSEGPGLQTCGALFAARPQAEEAAKCFSTLKAEQRMRELLAQHPELPWLSFYLGTLTWDRPESEGFYRVAAGRFAEPGEVPGELRARLNLQNRLLHGERVEEAAFEEQRALRLARASGDPYAIARVKVGQARALLVSGRDLGGASTLLAETEHIFFPGASDDQKAVWLSASGEVNLQVGRFHHAERSFLMLKALAIDDRNTGIALDGLLRVLMERAAEQPSYFGPSILPQARGSLAQAQAAKNANAEFRTQFILGELTDGMESRDHFVRCAEKSATPAKASFCWGGWARKLAEKDPKQAQAVLRRALADAEKSEDPWSRPYLLGDQMRVSWRTQSHPQAIADSWQALDAIEQLRRAQGPDSQAGLFSTWSDDYYWFSGSLLEPNDRSAGDVAQAFAVTERLRGRTLLEKLAGVRPESLSQEVLERRLQGIVEAIKNVEGRIGDPKLPPRERENARLDSAALALQRSEVDRQRLGTASRVAEPERFFTLEEVRQALAADEALLSYQVAPWKDWTGASGGGSWLTVVTRGATHVYRLPGREELRYLVESLTNPLETDGTGSEDEARNLDALQQKLLAPALAELPSGIQRLILVPDDELNKVPFAALRPAAAALPLVARYQITVAPSATLWLRWRRDLPRPAAVPALVLADPVRLGDRNLPPLPLAAQEGEEVVDALGGKSRLETGEGASEAFLKGADLNPYGLLHFATHSVSDDEDPERSSVRLTPGAGEDGHLEIAEILKLQKEGMDGKVVVLSTCKSAGGKILRGEGVMSLARAFFQAGAHTVVGSLWPVEDHDGMKLFERFYHHLGRGASVAAALRAAQRERSAEGAPVAAWAGFVVLGDGDLVPLRGGSHRSWPPVWGLMLLVIGAALGAFLAVRARPKPSRAPRTPRL